MRKNMFKIIIIIIIVILFMIYLVRCLFAYHAGIEFKNEIINQFENGYKDYLYYLDNDSTPEPIDNIFSQYISDTFNDPHMEGKYLMLKDSVTEYKKIKKILRKIIL